MAALLLLFAPPSSFALSDLLVGSFIDDGLPSLSRGGLKQLPQRQESLDFSAPLFLDSQGKFRVDTSYENQRTLRIYNGRWSGTHAYSERLESSAAAPFSLWGGRLKGDAGAGYGFRSVDIEAKNSREGIFVSGQENVEGGKGGVYLNAVDRVALGVALISKNLRGGMEVPIEAEVTALPYLKLGYKRSFAELASDLQLTLSGHQGDLSLENVEEINELYAVLDYGNRIYVKFANELRQTGNSRMEARINLPAPLYLTGSYNRRNLAGIDETISVDAKPGGTFHGDFKDSEYRVGAGAALSQRWTVEGNYRHGNFSTEGGGVGSSSAVAGFWPSLLLGNYNYLYSASIATDQYHLGAEYQGERFSFGIGCQYLDVRPQAKLDYWRSVLFGIGHTDAGTMKLKTDRIEMIFFSLGLGYRWSNVSLRYAVGQFIPIATHDTDQQPAQQTSSGGGGGSDFFSSVADKIKHNPGGNLQRVSLIVTF
jgi:hypothetical protein